MDRSLTIAGACLNQTPIDWENNASNIGAAISEAKKKKVDILCLPELAITGYGCEDLFLSDWLYATALEKLQEIVPLTAGIAVAVGLPVRQGGKNYNTVCFISDKKIKGFYAKQKLAIEGVHYEGRWFTPWKANQLSTLEVGGEAYPFGHVTFEEQGIRVGFEICEDAWQPDRPCEKLDQKVDVVLNPSASHFAFGKAAYREQLVVESSKTFDCVYVYANLLGNEAGRMIYDGDVLVAQKGKLIGKNQRLIFQDFKLLCLAVDFKNNKAAPQIELDFTDQNEEFAHAAGLALFDYCRKSKSKGFVLSLSGGADSATIATLVRFSIKIALDQLGKSTVEKKLGVVLKGEDEAEWAGELLTTAYQATENSSKETLESAQYLAKHIGATFYQWSIDPVLDHYRSTIADAIGRDMTWEGDDVALQNIQARSRAPGIWMLANLENKLLLATSNRSEGDVGYATMDGDTSGSISPIAGVSKSFVLKWLRYAEEKLGFEGLSKVNQLTPTAELRPTDQNQTDEEDLMPYEVLVCIERAAIFERKSPSEVFESLRSTYDPIILKEWIRKFYRLWTRNQWKRERYAPSFHFDDFNIDPRSWCRFPILSGGYEEELEALDSKLNEEKDQGSLI